MSLSKAGQGHEVNARFSTLLLNQGLPASSAGTGDLVVRGGAGIAGDLFVDGKIDVDTLTIVNLQVTLNPLWKYVMTSDDHGNATWQPEPWEFSSDTKDIWYQDGNVMLGSSFTAERRLHIEGSLLLNGDMILGASQLISQSVFNIRFDETQRLRLGTTLQLNTLVVGSTGVGIGISSASEALDVLGNVRLSGNFVKGLNSFFLPADSDILCGVSATQILSNKTLVEPGVTGNLDMQSSGRIVNVNTPLADGDAATKGYVDTVIQGLDWQESVLDKDLTVPPGSPSTGDRYIVGPSATGAWVGNDNEIAEWNGSAWIFSPPDVGFATLVESESQQYIWNGTSWVKLGTTLLHSSFTGLSFDDHPQYLLRAGRAGGQIALGSTGPLENLVLESTSDASKGDVLLQPNGGNVGVGISNAVNVFDLQIEPRTGTHPSGLLCYLSGDIDTAVSGFELRKTDGTQGVGIGSGAIYATGSDSDHTLELRAKGTGSLRIIAGVTGRMELFNTTLTVLGSTSTDSAQIVELTAVQEAVLRLISDVGAAGNNQPAVLELNQNSVRTTGTTGQFRTGARDQTLLLDAQTGIHLSTGGEIQITVTDQGYLGLGTTNPSVPLHVVGGSVRIEAAEPSVRFDSTGTDFLIHVPGDRMILAQTGSAEVLVVHSNDRVGVGVSSPTEALDIQGNVRWSGTMRRGTESFTFPVNSDLLMGVTSVDVVWNKTFHDTVTDFGLTGNLKFSIAGSTDTKTMTIASQHTDNHTATLFDNTDTVTGVTTVQTLNNKTLVTPTISSINGLIGTTLTLPVTEDTLVARDTTDTLTNKTLDSPLITGDLTLGDLDAVVTDQVRARDNDGLRLTNAVGDGLFIRHNADIGIGTTTPNHRLHVVGDVVRLDTNLIVDGGVLFVDKTLDRVGIGTTAPDTDLHLIGSMTISQDLLIEGKLTVTGTSTILDVATLTVQDNLIKINTGTTGDFSDFGFIGTYIVGGVTKYAGLFRDTTGTQPFRLFRDLEFEPVLTVDLGGTGYNRGDLVVGIVDTEQIDFGSDLPFSSGSQRMILTNGGNLGLGTNPDQRLHVSGNTQLDGSLTVNGTDWFVNSGNSQIGVGTTTPACALDIQAGSGVRIVGAANQVLTGQINPIASTTVTGSGTAFLTELIPGDRVLVSGETRTVTAIASDTQLTVDTAFSNNGNDTSPERQPALLLAVTGSNPKFVVQDNGRVGLGMFAPSHPFHVNQTVGSNWTAKIENVTSQVFLAHSGGFGICVNTGVAEDTNYALQLRNLTHTSSAPIMHVTNEAKIGVRNNSPAEILDITTTTAGEGARIGNAKIGVWEGSNQFTSFTHDDVHGTTASYAVKQFNDGETFLNTASGKELHFRVADVDQMLIDSLGRLGINTTSPQKQLHVVGDVVFVGDLDVQGSLVISGDVTDIETTRLVVADPLIKLADGNTGADLLDVGFYGEYGPTGSPHFFGLYRDADDQTIKFFDQANVEPGATTITKTGTYKNAPVLLGELYVDAVGTTSTTFAEVHLTGETGGRIEFGTTTVTTADARLYSASGDLKIAATTEVHFEDINADTFVTVNFPNRRMGIGTSAPVETLQVQGNVRADEFITVSDGRLKTSIQSLSSRQALCKVHQIRPVQFKWRRDPGAEKFQYGVIAQELEQVLPDLVRSNGADKAVNYQALTVYLLAAVHELSQQINAGR